MSNGSKTVIERDVVTIRFAGDSGDGMQLTGTQFSNNTAIFGNDLATLPDYPSEIRAPKGSLAGVSSFQIQFSNRTIHTPGDELDVLVAMNPAGLKVHMSDLKDNGLLIINTANFNKKNLKLAGWGTSPVDDNTLDGFQVIPVDMNLLVASALDDMGLSSKVVQRSTNMFALGLLYWLYGRNMETTLNFLKKKFATKPEIVEANKKAISAGFNYGETIEAIKTTFKVSRAKFEKGTYRNIMGNHAMALGLLAASEKSNLELFYGGYPITPASDVLHYLSGYKQFGVKTFQAEDEIAGIVSTIGASFAGDLAVTATSGPGLALKSEAMGLAVMTELPIVIINVQRGGPSTGLPTKTEQSDLFQAMYNRNGEAPMVVLAAATPADGFFIAYEACRIALKYMTPVIILSDGYIANGSEPWKVPTIDELPEIITQRVEENTIIDTFGHDNDLLARPWAIPGTPNLEHRIGGLEKQDKTGNVNYEPENHQFMVELRQKKIDIIANDIPDANVFGKDSGDLLVVGWGGTHGAIRSAVEKAQTNGVSVSHVHLRNINPFPKNLGEILVKFQKILVPELNLGQLTTMLRAKVQGKPFTSSGILQIINETVKG